MENYSYDISFNEVLWIINKDTNIVYPISIYAHNKPYIYNIETQIRCPLDLYKDCYGQNSRILTNEQIIELFHIVPKIAQDYYKLENGKIVKILPNEKYSERINGFKKIIFVMKKEFEKTLKKQNIEIEL